MKWEQKTKWHQVCGRFTICAAMVGERLRYSLADGASLVMSADSAEECRQMAETLLTESAHVPGSEL